MKNNKGGRPALPKTKKRDIKICFYINDIEAEKLEQLKLGLLKSSPALTLNEFFRKVIDNFDSTLLDFLELSPIDEVKNHLKTKRAYNSIFK